MGWNLPVAALTTSCPTMPPNMAHIGESVARAPSASCMRVTRRSSSSLTAAPASAAPLIALAMSKSSAAAVASATAGSAPPCRVAYSSRARKPRCSSPERPYDTLAAGVPMTARKSSEKDVAAGAILDSSTSQREPGAFMKSCSDLYTRCFGCRISARMPPIWYCCPLSCAASAAGSSSFMRFLPLLTSRILRGPASLRAAIPLTSEKPA
mmetsp:Transcript_37197/g.79258  ORF Transcript_37197/g.79258 Transcript_37197/m.79258 type:complete len:210 (+) Transcript_37197:133-762(+)